MSRLEEIKDRISVPLPELFAHAPADLATMVAVVEAVQRIRETVNTGAEVWRKPCPTASNALTDVRNLLDDALRAVTE